MLGRGHGVKEAATQADVIKLFPATAFSVWQDALYLYECRWWLLASTDIEHGV
jgi:hypothetical protein